MAAKTPRSEGAGQAQDFAEFEALLADLGAETPEHDATTLDLKDVTIAELSAMLEALRPLGDRLAEAEQQRIEALARIEALERAQDTETSARLQREVERLNAALAQADKTLARTKQKLAERQRIAGERWRELRSLRAERSRLHRELARLRQQVSRPGTA
jgi:DNA repair exonuclease SbcCD ATPase subunit